MPICLQLCLLSFYNSSHVKFQQRSTIMACKPKIFTIWLFKKKFANAC